MPTDRERERDELVARITLAYEDAKQAIDALNQDHPDESLDKVIKTARVFEKEFGALCEWLNTTLRELKAEREQDQLTDQAIRARGGAHD